MFMCVLMGSPPLSPHEFDENACMEKEDDDDGMVWYGDSDEEIQSSLFGATKKGENAELRR